MNVPDKLKWLLLVLPLMQSSCGVSKSKSFPTVGRITRIEIVGNFGSKVAKTIENEGQIVKIVAFVDEHRTGWTTPWAGVPVPRIIADLYDGDEFKGHLGVGSNFFETQREGGFFSKSADKRERRRFLDLIGVRPDLIEK